MIGNGIYLLRHIPWLLGNLRRRMRRPPDFILITLEGTYSELRAPRGSFLQRRLYSPRPALQELVQNLQAIKRDTRIKGVVFHLAQPGLSLTQIQTLRDLIHELRASGKRVVLWSSTYDAATYYLACAADEILMQPGGLATPMGVRTGFVFLAEALERMGVKADFVQVSPYKSAADALTRSSMSDEMREMVNWLIDSRYKEFIRGVAEGRGITEEDARDLVDQAPYTDLHAVDTGVVDKLVSAEDLPSYLGTNGKPARFAPWESVRNLVLRERPVPPGRYVALLRIEGDIMDGRSQRPPAAPPMPFPFLFNRRAGDLSVVQDARNVLADTRAAALVVYVDSRGGSATASEAMAAALARVATRIPVVASMGPVAGSGGYYVCTPTQWIVAQADTITGSIGVLTGKLVSAGLLDRLHLGRETISRGFHATFFDAEKPFDDGERDIVTKMIRRVYDVFLERVATSRRLTLEEVNAVGGGRVWTGLQALEHGLVDEIGGLDKAAAKARELAGLHPRARIREVRPSRSPVAPSPLPDPATIINYAREGLGMFDGLKPLLICPISPDDGQVGG